MPKKGLSWLITLLGTGISVYGLIFILEMKERYALEYRSDMINIGAMVFFAIGMVATGQLVKWWDKKK